MIMMREANDGCRRDVAEIKINLVYDSDPTNWDVIALGRLRGLETDKRLLGIRLGQHLLAYK